MLRICFCPVPQTPQSIKVGGSNTENPACFNSDSDDLYAFATDCMYFFQALNETQGSENCGHDTH